MKLGEKKDKIDKERKTVRLPTSLVLSARPPQRVVVPCDFSQWARPNSAMQGWTGDPCALYFPSLLCPCVCRGRGGRVRWFGEDEAINLSPWTQ